MPWGAEKRRNPCAPRPQKSKNLGLSSGTWFLSSLRGPSGKTEQALGDYDEALRLLPNFEMASKARSNAVARLSRMHKPVSATNFDAAKLAAAPVLDEAALTKTFTAKTWQARQGPWQATLEFRAGGTFRQRSKDTSESSTLEVTWDGVWGVSRGKLCIYTNVDLYLAAHEAGGQIALVRDDGDSKPGVLEYFGAANLKDLSTDAVSDPVAELCPSKKFCCVHQRAPPKAPKRSSTTCTGSMAMLATTRRCPNTSSARFNSRAGGT